MNPLLKKNLTTTGKIIYYTGCVRLFKDGDGYGQLFRWWHPISWIIWIIALQVCGIVGEPVNEVVPMTLNRYWRVRKKEIEWF